MNKKELREILADTLAIPETTPLIERQINKFVSELGLSYKEIAQALVFYMEVEEGNYDPKYGIGIVPHVMDRAREYFRKKREERDRMLKSVEEANKQPDIILEVTKVRKRRKFNRIKIDEIEVD